MQIQYNCTRLEEWCKSHEMPEGTLQLEHLLQAAKLLQSKKVSIGYTLKPGYRTGLLTSMYVRPQSKMWIIYSICAGFFLQHKSRN